MTLNLQNTAAVILAAGKGTRMGGTSSKVLRPILGRSMINYTISNLKNVPIKDIYVVTGHNYEAVQTTLGRSVNFVHQKEQLGTANAIACALYEIPMNIETIIVMNGDDSAFYDPLIIDRLLESHIKSGAVMTVLSAEVDQPHGLGRINRVEGEVVGIIEEADATEEQKMISEVNTGCYVFDIDWLRSNISNIVPSKSGEYYIVSLLALAVGSGKSINMQTLSHNKEWWGVNTPEELVKSSQIMLKELIKKNRPKLFVLDFDNTLFDTAKLKEIAMTKAFSRFFERSFDKKTANDQIIQFWKFYEEVKKKMGWISVPDLVDQIAAEMKLENIAISLKRVLYSLRFKDYVKPGVLTVLNYLRSQGKVVILNEGDMVYSTAKILGSGVIESTEDLFICDHKTDLFPSIQKMYSNYEIIAVDDQVRKLESLAKMHPITSIWINVGPYSSVSPEETTFVPTHTISSFIDIEKIIRNMI